MTDLQRFCEDIRGACHEWIEQVVLAFAEVTIVVKRVHLVTLAKMLRDESIFAFNQLVDLCGIDYLEYGVSDWHTTTTTATGFGRGVEARAVRNEASACAARFAVIYHLLSLKYNQRLRLKVMVPESQLIVDSVTAIWPAADWYEREAFDLFGIFFADHPDLRRLLTDYGFVGYPFRKDFPLIGQIEARYDAAQEKVVYEPVSIAPRVLEPKVIRYQQEQAVEREESTKKV